MAALWAGHYILQLWFLSFFFFSSPILSGCRLDVYHTSTRYGLSANLECRYKMCCARLAENTEHKTYAKKSPSVHHRTTLSGYIFATKAGIDNRKKNLLNSNISSTCPHNMVNVGPLTRLRSVYQFGAPLKFQRVSGLGFVTAPTSLNGGPPNFARCLAVS